MKKRQSFAATPTVMRLTIAPVVLMLLTAETLLATRSGAQELLDARVSLSVHDARISKIIALIGRQTGVRFLYSSDADLERQNNMRMSLPLNLSPHY